MDDRLPQVEARIEEIVRALNGVEARLTTIERRLDRADDSLLAGAQPQEVSAQPHRAGPDAIDVISLVGRTFVAVGGAYLLRALTDSGAVAPAVGIALGLLYAIGWIARADRAAETRRLSAIFHGTAATLIAYPLIWEATTRFHSFSPEGSTAALAAVTALTLTVAWRRSLASLAWIAVIVALPTTLGLIVKTGSLVSFSAFLIALTLAVHWFDRRQWWRLLEWPVALTTDLVLLELAVRTLTTSTDDALAVVVALQLALPVGGLVVIGVRTLLRDATVTTFETVQSTLAMAVGFGGALSVTEHVGAGAGALGVAALLFGTTSYALAFLFVERERGSLANLYFYTTLALVLILAGVAVVTTGAPRMLMWTTLGGTGIWLAGRYRRPWLAIHGVVYTLAAIAVSGLLGLATSGLIGPVRQSAVAIGVVPAIVLLAAISCCWLHAGHERPGFSGRIPRLLAVFVVLWAFAGLTVALLVQTLASTAVNGADAGIVATIRTIVLVGAALLLAWVGRRDRFLEERWLVYPLLAATGLKLLVDDFMHSRPATLFIALALYGATLILVSRLRQPKQRAAA